MLMVLHVFIMRKCISQGRVLSVSLLWQRMPELKQL